MYTIKTVKGHNAPTEDETMSKIKIKFGKIDRCEPASAGGDGWAIIYARQGRGEWAQVGGLEVLAGYDSWRTSDQCHVCLLLADFGGYSDHESLKVEGGPGFRTVPEGKRILKSLIAERLSN